MSIPPPYGPPQEPQGPQGQHPAPQGQVPYPPPRFTYGGRPGFAPYGLYGPYGPRPPAVVNGVAVAALVFGVLCLVPAVGLVLGLVALRQIKRRGEKGRGMAIAGTVLSSLGLALWGAVLASGVLTDVWEGIEDGARGNSVLALAKGECFNSPGGLEGWTTDADRVPCAREHDGEVFAVVTLPGDRYPGDDSLTDTADERCYDLQDAYVMDGWALPGHVDVYYLIPSGESWRFGDREITCVFGDRDARKTLTGSLRRDETTLDAHQLAYLKATGVLDAALDDAPGAEYPDEDLTDDKEWAGRVEEALAEQTGLLRAHEWPAGAERSVADLVADLGKARQEWGKAADAADAGAYHEHEEKGWELIDPHRSVTAREALGLATTPPEDEEEGERDTGSGELKV
ncbi:DUF4190 domain-containing protein [Streptomyces sp. NPDC020731]|uniref:DUF4190 domain-containing protein n=1 Tax=Streptomyces sp. NPDC020731 TaxID=3365085 RepID=UPI00379D03D8